MNLYPKIPDNAAPWPNQGVRFDQANVLLPWGVSEQTITKKVLESGMTMKSGVEGAGFRGIRTSFMSHNVQVVLNYFREFEDPHDELTFSACHLIDWPKDSYNDYHQLLAELIDQIGEPTVKDLVVEGWPNTSRCWWDFEFARVLFTVGPDRGDLPEVKLSFRRKGLPRLEERWEKTSAQYF
jgi:hypothetical protein